MRKLRLALPLLLCLVLFACATPWQDNMTKGYEAAGIMGKTYYSIAKSSCEAVPPAVPALPADKCEQLKKINNDARKAYLLAGDSLILAIETDDAIQQQTLLTQYNTLLASFNKVLIQFVTLLREYKVLGQIQPKGVK